MIVVHVPHASTEIPVDVRKEFILPDAKLMEHISLLTDWHTDELSRWSCVQQIVYPVSRFVVDPERYEDDSGEPMSCFGLGAVYTKSIDGSVLRIISASRREALIDRYYRSHHRALNDLVRRCESQRVVFVDFHSYSEKPLPYENHDAFRPDICLGIDKCQTSEGLAVHIHNFFSKRGYVVGINTPYAGVLIPSKFVGHPNLDAIMLEIRKDLYCDTNGNKKSTFPTVLQDMKLLFRSLR